jgi:hypothetical protein
VESSKFIPKPLPGSELADAERRRAIALRALDLRLQEKSAAAAAGIEASSSSSVSASASRIDLPDTVPASVLPGTEAPNVLELDTSSK